VSKLIDLSRVRKHPVVIDNWLVVRDGRVIGTRGVVSEYTQRVIAGSARDNRISVAELHRALIAYAATFGDPGDYIVTCGQVIRWWRRQKRQNTGFARIAA
jgi:hypothetical protein